MKPSYYRLGRTRFAKTNILDIIAGKPTKEYLVFAKSVTILDVESDWVSDSVVVLYYRDELDEVEPGDLVPWYTVWFRRDQSGDITTQFVKDSVVGQTKEWMNEGTSVVGPKEEDKT